MDPAYSLRDTQKPSGAHIPLDPVSSQCSAFYFIQTYESCLHCCSIVDQHQKFILPDGAPVLSGRGGLLWTIVKVFHNGSFNICSGTECLQNQCQLITFIWGLCRLWLLLVLSPNSFPQWQLMKLFDSTPSQFVILDTLFWKCVQFIKTASKHWSMSGFCFRVCDEEIL